MHVQAQGSDAFASGDGNKANGVNQMTGVTNGMSAAELPALSWVKAQASSPQGNCVEMAQLADKRIALRNSRFPEGPCLIYTPAEISALITGAREGDFDHLLA